MNTNDFSAQKAALRRRLIEARDLQAPGTVEKNSRAIMDRLRAFEPLLAILADCPSAPVGLYAAFRGEPDIRPLTAFLLSKGVTVAFPAIVGPAPERQLRFGVYDPSISLDQFLQPGLFGVPEPPVSSLLSFGHDMTALIVPGVAFDEQGGRMGFGKGYYDRVIASLPKRPLLIGVAHPFQLQASPLPMTTTDQRMDYIILPDRVVVVQ